LKVGSQHRKTRTVATAQSLHIALLPSEVIDRLFLNLRIFLQALGTFLSTRGAQRLTTLGPDEPCPATAPLARPAGFLVPQ
jgi:hypothetical protein